MAAIKASIRRHKHTATSNKPTSDLPPCSVAMCSGSFDYATPQDQQFNFEYDLSMQADQRSRSPAASPVRHVMKRPRHAAGEQEGRLLFRQRQWHHSPAHIMAAPALRSGPVLTCTPCFVALAADNAVRPETAAASWHSQWSSESLLL